MVNGPHTVLDLNEKPIPTITNMAPEAPKPETGEGQAAPANPNVTALAGAEPETPAAESEPDESPSDDEGIGVSSGQSQFAIHNGKRVEND